MLLIIFLQTLIADFINSDNNLIIELSYSGDNLTLFTTITIVVITKLLH